MGIVIVVIEKGSHNTDHHHNEKGRTDQSSSGLTSDQTSPPSQSTTPQPSKNNSSSRSPTEYPSTTTPSETSPRRLGISPVTTTHKIYSKSRKTTTVEGNLVLLWFLYKGRVFQLSACIFGIRLQSTFPANNCPSGHYFNWRIFWGYI